MARRVGRHDARSGRGARPERVARAELLDIIGSMAETISARLVNVVLPEAGGSEVRLGSLWEKNPAVLVFLRHYG